MARPHPTAPPLDAARLDRLALRYVERYATTRGKLREYLTRKVRERGWEGADPADPAALAERMAKLGYIDDRGFAEARAAAMGRRGLGARRIAGAFHQAGIAAEDAAAVRPAIDARAESSALAFARRRRLGPFGVADPDRPVRDRALAAMLRAGHGFDLSRRIVALTPEELASFEAELDESSLGSPR